MAQRSEQGRRRAASNPRHWGHGHGDVLQIPHGHEREPPGPPIGHPEACTAAKSDSGHDGSTQDGHKPWSSAFLSQPHGPPAVLHSFSWSSNLNSNPKDLGSASAYFICSSDAAADGSGLAKEPVGGAYAPTTAAAATVIGVFHKPLGQFFSNANVQTKFKWSFHDHYYRTHHISNQINNFHIESVASGLTIVNYFTLKLPLK